MSHLGFLNCCNELFTYACFICDGIILFNVQVSIQEEECVFAVLMQLKLFISVLLCSVVWIF